MAAHKRPLEAVAAEQEALRPRERRRARAATAGQMARQGEALRVPHAARLRLCSVQRLLQQLRSLLAGQLMLLGSLTVSIQDPIRSTVQTEMQGRQAASLPNGISEPPRHMRQGFPETGGNTRVKLGFVDVDRPEDPLYTGYPVQWMNKKDAKVAVFENDRQITQGDLSKLQIEILAVHAEFFTERGQADFTKEEFNKQICIHKGNESVLTTVNLVNGAAYIGSVIFTESSQRKRLRLTARVKGQDLVRVQEAITDPFVVKVGKKIYPPSKEEAVIPLGEDFLKGKHCTLLAEKILLRSTLIKHATTPDPGVEIYSFIVVEENTELLFNDFYNLVGIMIRRYFPVNVLDQFQQIKVNNWKMSAYKKFDERENSGGLNPDYFTTDGGPVSALPLNNDAGPSVQAGTLWQYHNGKAAQHEVGDRHPLNGLSRAAVLSNNDAGPSNQEILPFPQHMHEQTAYQGPGEHDPSVPQNGAPYSLHQGNILNDQGPLSAQPTIPSHNFSPVRQDDMIADASQSGFTSFDVEEWLNLPIDEADHGIVPPNNAELLNSNIPFDGDGHDGGNQ
ncbi:hypothetical protein ZWY2020_034664 [Hordeum vulgare]|nr:hypothetical protein ZWY2020_034664 [Hordeum vulgare]